MINFKNEHFTKQYDCVNKLKIDNLKVELTHITLINKILSYQLNGKKYYEPYCDIAEELFISERKLYTVINDLKKAGILIVTTKRLGPKIGSITNLSIDLDKLDKHLIDKPKELPANKPQVESSNESDMQVPQEVETPAVTNFINNYGKSINIYLENVDFFNDVILKDKYRFDILKEVGYTDEEVNEALDFEKTEIIK